jgi:hypothetical protein
MSTGGLILAIGFIIGILALVLWPVLLTRKTTHPTTDSNLSPLALLRAERESILLALRDMDFDHQMGKYTLEDYQSQRESLMQRGVDILKQIDAYESDAIEAAVRAHRSA